jgi:hypothetical protein
MFPARFFLLFIFCSSAFCSSLADEAHRELTTEEALLDPGVPGALKAIDAWLEGVYWSRIE